MVRSIYSDSQGTSIRTSEISRYSGALQFQELAFKFVRQGKESYVIGGRKFPLSDGCFLIGNRSMTSEVQIDSQSPAQGFCMDISLSMVKDICTSTIASQELFEFIKSDQFPVISGKINNSRSVQLLAHKMSDWSNDLPADHQLEEELLQHVAPVIDEIASTYHFYSKTYYLSAAARKDLFQRMLIARTYIDDCFLQNPSLDQLSQIAQVSKYHFLRLFKETFSLTPHQYVLSKRLAHGAQLLETELPIADIACLCGFADAPSFHKAFVKHYKTSPGLFRKKSNN